MADYRPRHSISLLMSPRINFHRIHLKTITPRSSRLSLLSPSQTQSSIHTVIPSSLMVPPTMHSEKNRTLIDLPRNRQPYRPTSCRNRHIARRALNRLRDQTPHRPTSRSNFFHQTARMADCRMSFPHRVRVQTCQTLCRICITGISSLFLRLRKLLLRTHRGSTTMQRVINQCIWVDQSNNTVRTRSYYPLYDL